MEDRTITSDLREFAEHLRREEKSPGTVEKYLRDASAFAAHMNGAPVTRDAVAAWRDGLAGELQPSTVNAKVAAVNSLLRFLGWEDCRVKSLRVQRQVFRERGKDLSRGEYQRLLDAAPERTRMVMETICATGIRVSELRFITVEAARAGVARIRLKGKIRTVLIPVRLCKKLLKYAQKQETASGEIFLTGNGNPLTRGQIWADMKKVCEKAGVDSGKVFPHNLRHLFARCFYDATRDIVKLADVLGHSSIETTRIYLISTGEEHARVLDGLGLVS